MVDLPQPEEPTIATHSFSLISTKRFLSTGTSGRSGYEKETLVKETGPERSGVRMPWDSSVVVESLRSWLKSRVARVDFAMRWAVIVVQISKFAHSKEQ